MGQHPHGRRPRKSGGRTFESRDLVDAYVARELSRRDLLQRALAGSALLIGGGLVGCGDDDGPGTTPPADMGTDAGPPPTPPPDPDMGPPELDSGLVEPPDAGPPPPAGHLVGMGYSETDYLGALDLALAESMDLSFVTAGQTVYFKVNCNNGDLYPHSTRPELIVELARRCRDHGATRIIVGDRSFWGDPDTLGNMEANGVAGAARDAGAELVVFDADEVDWVMFSEDDAPNWVGGFRLPMPVVEADHIINLPCVKTHFISGFTMSLKNVFGLVNPLDRRRAGNLDVHVTSRLWRQIAQVNRFVTPSLNILDGYEALITGGPTRRDGAGATYASPHVIIVSSDRIAADVTGIAVLQTLSPRSEEVTQSAAWANPQIAAAAADGIGIGSPDLYDLSGPSVPSIEEYRALAIAT
ncbi:MAG: DUF362 domain-containing protein [Deltaproteobacteria bacterium]|nr:DUF362 domain-containing protein [Deltaproteobacteria bacterium]